MGLTMTDEQHHQISDYLSACRFRSFAWGQWDCTLFMADVMAILSGNDFAAPYRGNYSDRDSALNLIPARLPDIPEYIGLRQIPSPIDGAVWWAAGSHPEGALGIYWQGQALQPGRRGLKRVFADISTLKFYA